MEEEYSRFLRSEQREELRLLDEEMPTEPRDDISLWDEETQIWEGNADDPISDGPDMSAEESIQYQRWLNALSPDDERSYQARPRTNTGSFRSERPLSTINDSPLRLLPPIIIENNVGFRAFIPHYLLKRNWSRRRPKTIIHKRRVKNMEKRSKTTIY